MGSADLPHDARYGGVPLSTELVLGTLIVFALALVATGIAVFATGEETIRLEAQREAQIAARAVLEATVASPDTAIGETLAKTLLEQTPSISGIWIQLGHRDVFQEPPAAFDETAEASHRTVWATVDDQGEARVTVRVDPHVASPARQRLTVHLLLAIGGSIIGAALLLIALMHSRITKPLRRLRSQVLDVTNVATGLPRELQSLSDVLAQQAGASLAELHRLERTESELQRANALHRLMLRELDHRVRNNLASISALVDLERYASSDVDTFANRLGGRLGSMQNVQELLLDSQEHAVELHALFESLLPDDVKERVQYSGPPVEVAGGQAVPFGMTLHELLTNALRHGSLSNATGTIEVTWTASQAEADGRRLLQLDWAETGGPCPEATPSPGSGTGILSGLVQSELGGSVDLRYPPTGAVHRFMLRLRPLEHGGEL